MKNMPIPIIVLMILLSSSAQAFPPAPIAQSGQTTCWNTSGTSIDCAGTGQEGEQLGGVPWPSPRFIDVSCQQ